MLCKLLNKIDLVLFHIMFLLLSHTDTIIYSTNNGTLTRLFTLPVLGQYHASTGTGTAPAQPIHCASTDSMLNHYYPSTGPIQHAVLGQHWANTLRQYMAKC